MFGFVLGIAAVIAGGFAIRRWRRGPGQDLDHRRRHHRGGTAVIYAFFKIFGLDTNSGRRHRVVLKNTNPPTDRHQRGLRLEGPHLWSRRQPRLVADRRRGRKHPALLPARRRLKARLLTSFGVASCRCFVPGLHLWPAAGEAARVRPRLPRTLAVGNGSAPTLRTPAPRNTRSRRTDLCPSAHPMAISSAT